MASAFVFVSIVAYSLLLWICVRQGLRRAWTKVFDTSHSLAWSALYAVATLAMVSSAFYSIFLNRNEMSAEFGGLHLTVWPAMFFASLILARCVYILARK
jgi:hypothetical protein